MNRLLFRSNRSEIWPTRVEILFMNVRYLAVATALEGPVIERLGTVEEYAELVPWRLTHTKGQSVYRVRSRGGDGVIVAGGVALDESDAGPSEPSGFFMM